MKPGFDGSSCAVACNTMRRVPLTTVPRPFGRHQFDLEVASGRIAACGEHLERRDGIERVEPVEQHDLRVHTVIVGEAADD